MYNPFQRGRTNIKKLSKYEILGQYFIDNPEPISLEEAYRIVYPDEPLREAWKSTMNSNITRTRKYLEANGYFLSWAHITRKYCIERDPAKIYKQSKSAKKRTENALDTLENAEQLLSSDPTTRKYGLMITSSLSRLVMALTERHIKKLLPMEESKEIISLLESHGNPDQSHQTGPEPATEDVVDKRHRGPGRKHKSSRADKSDRD